MWHRRTTSLSAVIAGLDPAIHEAPQAIRVARVLNLRLIMDARVKPAHDALASPETSTHCHHRTHTTVMAGLDPAIHVFLAGGDVHTPC